MIGKLPLGDVGAIANGFATAELHHQAGQDPHPHPARSRSPRQPLTLVAATAESRAPPHDRGQCEKTHRQDPDHVPGNTGTGGIRGNVG